jgi:hypothetical protein
MIRHPMLSSACLLGIAFSHLIGPQVYMAHAIEKGDQEASP